MVQFFLLANSFQVILRPLDSISGVYGQDGVHKVTWVNGHRMEVCVYVCECEVGWYVSIYLLWVFFKADTNVPFYQITDSIAFHANVELL